MLESDLIDLAQHALLNAAVLSGPMLLAGALVGLLTGVFQAATQVHDQSLSFAPKLLVVLAVFSVTLPWLLGRLTEYASHMFSEIPGVH